MLAGGLLLQRGVLKGGHVCIHCVQVDQADIDCCA